jgi:hypothetical protein
MKNKFDSLIMFPKMILILIILIVTVSLVELQQTIKKVNKVLFHHSIL